MPERKLPSDDVSSAPESGTPRDELSGNNPSPPDRGLKDVEDGPGTAKDDPSFAGEER